MSATPLSAEGLHAAYGPREALTDVTCAFRAPGITAIVGPSGCGKTTLLRALGRTLELTPGARVTRGRVRFGGEDLAALDPLDARRRIGLVHQRPVAFPLSIRENVLFGVRFHRLWDGRTADEVVEEHLEQAGLWSEVRDRLHEPASRLSGGQLQRLCIARTLANRPEVLLLDEPCSSLDPRATAAIEALLVRTSTRTGVVVVTHNLAQARRLAEDAVILIDGRMVEHGEGTRALAAPADPRAREFLRLE